MRNTTTDLPKFVGTWRCFGVFGPVYEIIGEGSELPGDGQLMRVRIVETGEELDYRLAGILDDPYKSHVSYAALPEHVTIRTE